MQKVKKLCCRITSRRVVGAILVAASLINLIIVGAAFEVAASTAAPATGVGTVIDDTTLTFFVPTGTAEMTLSTAWTLTDIATQTNTSTPTVVPTSTLTNTPSPTLTPCIPQYSWPLYFVRRGDTLYSIANATDSSVSELMRVNCLFDTRIYVGQQLYVPRLPIITATTTSTTPPNTPTVFQNASACAIPNSADIVFSVTPYDPEGIRLLTASYKIQSGQIQSETNLKADGDTYYGSGPASDQYSTTAITYSFSATDSFGSVTRSVEYTASLQFCYQG